MNAILPGMKVDCVIGLCRVLDFGTATEAGGQTAKGWEGKFLWDFGKKRYVASFTRFLFGC